MKTIVKKLILTGSLCLAVCGLFSCADFSTDEDALLDGKNLYTSVSIGNN